MKRARKYKSPIVEEIEKRKNPLEAARSRKKLEISALICDAIENQGIRKGDLAERLGKYNSEITKWVSGVHNFSTDILSDIEEILQIKLLQGYEKQKSVSLKTALSIDNVQAVEAKNFYYNDAPPAAINSKESNSQATAKIIPMSLNKFAMHE